MKPRASYRIGDQVFFNKKNVPSHYEVKYKGVYTLVLSNKTYNGYSIQVMTNEGKVVHTFHDVPTKYFSKGNNKIVLVKRIEKIQDNIKEAEHEIATIKDRLTLMDELGCDEVDEDSLVYARKFSKNMNVTLRDAYRAIVEK